MISPFDVVSYWNWLIGMTYDGKHRLEQYSKVFHHMFSQYFCAFMDDDISRSLDGVELRQRYSFDDQSLLEHLDQSIGPCTILEMMLGLSFRCSNDILGDPREDPCYGKLFWIMMENLGLDHYSDDTYDQNSVQEILEQFIERRYLADGRGGLFIFQNPAIDARQLSIWAQMCDYINENPNLIG